ncbi:MAG TPA: response regulator transcription factor [Pyrinomonadaceae bacterium]|nr:response regulator transcription factor [Pyrinomonadaceae bacterium]
MFAGSGRKTIPGRDDETGVGRISAPELVKNSSQPSSRPTRILIADDQALVRAGICELIKQLPGVEVAAQANDGREALRLIESHNPDIVLLDAVMPGMNGLEATVLTKKEFPEVKVIILSDQASEQIVFRALRLGAEGFVLKDDSVAELQAAIKIVAAGARYISPNVQKKNLVAVRQTPPGEPEQIRLTGRQRVVLKLIAEGKSTKEIAGLLHISINTVKTHRLKLMERLGVHEITGVVRYAAKLGLINN